MNMRPKYPKQKQTNKGAVVPSNDEIKRSKRYLRNTKKRRKDVVYDVFSTNKLAIGGSIEPFRPVSQFLDSPTLENGHFYKVLGAGYLILGISILSLLDFRNRKLK
jgi:hypothetical protein